MIYEWMDAQLFGKRNKRRNLISGPKVNVQEKTTSKCFYMALQVDAVVVILTKRLKKIISTKERETRELKTDKD